MKEFVISRIPKTSKEGLEKLCNAFGRKQYEILEQAINFFVKSSLDPKDEYTPKMKLDQVNKYIIKRYEEDQKRIIELEKEVFKLKENRVKIRKCIKYEKSTLYENYYKGMFSVEEMDEFFSA